MGKKERKKGTLASGRLQRTRRKWIYLTVINIQEEGRGDWKRDSTEALWWWKAGLDGGPEAVRGCSVLCRMSSIAPGLYSLDASNILPASGNNQGCLHVLP